MLLRNAIVVGVIASMSMSARGQVLSTTQVQLLDQFNLIDFGDRTGTSESQGRIWIGGDLSGELANAGFKNLTASQYSTLTVIGSILPGQGAHVDTGGITVGGSIGAPVTLNGSAGTLSQVGGDINATVSLTGGSLQYGGAQTGTVNLDNGATATSVPGLTVSAPQAALFAPLQTLTGTLDALTPNGTISISNGVATFNGPATGNVAVFQIADGASFFNTVNAVLFDGIGSNVNYIYINVDGGPQTIVDAADMNDQALANEIIWNFNDTVNLSVNSELGGTVLAPNTAVSNTVAIDGTLVAGSFDENGEVHSLPYYQPDSTPITDVPEPASLGLLCAGIAVMCRVRRR